MIRSENRTADVEKLLEGLLPDASEDEEEEEEAGSGPPPDAEEDDEEDEDWLLVEKGAT